MNVRKYIACCDDGHDTIEFEFYSNHRANSKPNKEDAKREEIRKYGWRRATQIEIVSTYLLND